MLALEAPQKGYVKDVINGKYELSKSGVLVHKRMRKVVKGFKNKKGYIYDSFNIDGKTITKFRHRLVYETFIGEIPEGMQVNHKDENKQNNVLSNIDTLMTCNENNNWGTHNERVAKSLTNNPKKSKPVIQKSLDGKVIAIWPSASEIQRQLGYSFGNICNCCNGGHYVKGKWVNYTQAYGYIWQYYTE